MPPREGEELVTRRLRDAPVWDWLVQNTTVPDEQMDVPELEQRLWTSYGIWFDS